MDIERFDWPAIGKSLAFVVGIPTVLAFVIVLGLALTVNEYIGANDLDTLKVSGSFLYRFAFWASAWGVVLWRGAVMIREVHERIIDDMLVLAVVATIILFIVRIIVWISFEPVNSDGSPQFFLTSVDAGGALLMILVALIAARANRD